MKLKYILTAAGLAITLIVLLAVKLLLTDAKAATDALVEDLQKQFPQAKISIDDASQMTVVQANGDHQRLDVDPFVDLCSHLPGTCEQERVRLVEAFVRSEAEGAVDDARLRPYLLRTPAADDGTIIEPMVGDLSIGYAVFSDEVMLLIDEKKLAPLKLDRAGLRRDAIAHLDLVEPAPRLRPIMLVSGVVEMVATPDAAAQILSRRRMQVLAATLGEDRFYFALPRNGTMLMARVLPKDRETTLQVLQQTYSAAGNHASERLYLYEAGAFKEAPAS